MTIKTYTPPPYLTSRQRKLKKRREELRRFVEENS